MIATSASPNFAPTSDFEGSRSLGPVARWGHFSSPQTVMGLISFAAIHEAERAAREAAAAAESDAPEAAPEAPPSPPEAPVTAEAIEAPVATEKPAVGASTATVKAKPAPRGK